VIKCFGDVGLAIGDVNNKSKLMLMRRATASV